MKTKEVEIMHMLKRIDALSRRNPHNDMPPPPPPQPPMPDGNAQFGMPPFEQKRSGRGRLLSVLNDDGEMSQSQLAACLDIRPQSLSELLAKVEAEGFICRRQSDEDKRQTIVSITDEGKANLEAFREIHRRHAEEFLAPLSDDEKNQLLAILKKLINEKENREEN